MEPGPLCSAVPALRAGPGQPPARQPRPLMGPGCSRVAVRAAGGAPGSWGVVKASYFSGPGGCRWLLLACLWLWWLPVPTEGAGCLVGPGMGLRG